MFHFFFFFLILLALFSNLTAIVRACSPAKTHSNHHCPPFGASVPPYPFSSTPGCGHPSFQINCSSLPFSTISINNSSFSILTYDPNSSTLTLTLAQPLASTPIESCPHSPAIPRRPVNLSGSPFRVAEAFCSRLSSLRPCEKAAKNCSLCPWDCRLAKSPARVLGRDCSTPVRRRSSDPPCRGDVLEYLAGLLRIGIEIEWDEEEEEEKYFRHCRDCEFENGVCGFNTSDSEKSFVCFNKSETNARSRSRITPPWIAITDPKRIAALVTAFSLALVLLFTLIGFLFFRSRIRSSDDQTPTLAFLHRNRTSSIPLPPEFTYEELEASTNKFDPKRKIGDGGFGSVYLGTFPDGKFVAVKYLHRHNQRSKSFCNEILILSSIRHQNLVRLHGYCSDPRGLVLVYDYVPNGTLSDHLHEKTSQLLTWRVRIDIAFQTAMAMEYLHFAVVPPIVHRDLTSSNIFVEKDMRVKVGDFGLSRLLIGDKDNNGVWTGPQGTPGYLDPDYYKSFRLTEKSDVYSFGVILLELITGMRAVDRARGGTDISLADLVVSKIHAGLLAQVVDPTLGSGDLNGVEAAAELAFRCVAGDKDDRPDAREVVRELRIIRSRTRGNDGGDLVDVVDQGVEL